MADVAAMLDERRRWSSKGTFLLQLPQMSHQKIRPVDPGVDGQKINGNQVQDEWMSLG
jgi:hypothetical protein